MLNGETAVALTGLFLHSRGVLTFFVIFFMAEMSVHNYLQSLSTDMVLNIEEQFSIYSFIETYICMNS